MTTTTTESRIELADSVASQDITEEAQREPAEFLVAFAIGALVGVGLAAIWVPEPRRSRLPTVLGKRYRRARKAGATALEEVREAWEGTPTTPAVATRGEGVVETFRDLMRAIFRSLDERHTFASKFGVSEEVFLKGVLANFGPPPTS